MTLRPRLGRKRIASVIVTCASEEGRCAPPKVRSVLASTVPHARDRVPVSGISIRNNVLPVYNDRRPRAVRAARVKPPLCLWTGAVHVVLAALILDVAVPEVNRCEQDFGAQVW